MQKIRGYSLDTNVIQIFAGKPVQPTSGVVIAMVGVVVVVEERVMVVEESGGSVREKVAGRNCHFNMTNAESCDLEFEMNFKQFQTT